MIVSGLYTLQPLGPRLFTYIPDMEHPLTFVADDGRRFILTYPFETDLASIPRIFWIFPGFSPFDRPEAAILHDWLWECRKGKGLVVGFWESNRLLAEAIRGSHQPRWKAWICKRAIDLFGWPQWFRDERGTAD